MRTWSSAKWCPRIWPSKKPTGWRFWWRRSCWFSTAWSRRSYFRGAVGGGAVALDRAEGSHGGGGHSAEELKFIVSSSRREGHLRSFEEDAIQALLELPDYYAREIMVPRNAIVSISVDASLDQMLRRMREHQYSRLAGVRRHARTHHRLRPLQRHDADLGRAPDRDRTRPHRPPVSRARFCASRWWCRKPNRSTT